MAPDGPTAFKLGQISPLCKVCYWARRHGLDLFRQKPTLRGSTELL